VFKAPRQEVECGEVSPSAADYGAGVPILF